MLCRGAVAAIIMLILITGCGQVDQPERSTFAARPDSRVPLTERAGPTLVPVLPTPGTVSSTDSWTRPTDGMAMRYVPGGTFPMGSTAAEIEEALSLCRQHYHTCNRWYYLRAGPQHTISMDDFWLDQTEVTNAQYRGCVAEGACLEPQECKKGEATFGDIDKADHPVVCADWHQARAYCEWAGARLPTEAE